VRKDEHLKPQRTATQLTSSPVRIRRINGTDSPPPHPDVRNSYDPESRRQSELSKHKVNCTCTYNAPEPDRPLQGSHAACVIAQQYSSVNPKCALSRARKNSASVSTRYLIFFTFLSLLNATAYRNVCTGSLPKNNKSNVSNSKKGTNEDSSLVKCYELLMMSHRRKSRYWMEMSKQFHRFPSREMNLRHPLEGWSTFRRAQNVFCLDRETPPTPTGNWTGSRTNVDVSESRKIPFPCQKSKP
jgi:hypothetical protein